MSQWPNLTESISNGELKDKSALEKASEFATKCLQGLAPLDPKLNAAAGLVKSNQRTTARKSTSNRLQIPNIKPEATSPKSPVKIEPPFQAPKPEEAPAKIAMKPQKKPKTNSKVTVKIEEVKHAPPSEPPASFDRCDGVEQIFQNTVEYRFNRKIGHRKKFIQSKFSTKSSFLRAMEPQLVATNFSKFPLNRIFLLNRCLLNRCTTVT